MSFVQAAEELHVTPGAVSRQIKTLEQWLGAPLFQRRHRQVSLTALGRSYLDAVSEPLGRIAAASQRARSRDQGRALSICCYPTFALRWLVPRWMRFYDRHPDIDLQLTTSLQPVDLDRDGFDAAILVGRGPGDWPGLRAFRLCEVELMPVCSPALLAGGRPLRRPADLGRVSLLHGAPRPRDWHRWLAHAALSHDGLEAVDPDSGHSFDSLNLSIQAAIEGLGVAMAIRALVGEDLAAGRLVQPFGPVRVSGRPFHLVFARTRDPRLQAFTAWLEAEARAGGTASGPTGGQHG